MNPLSETSQKIMEEFGNIGCSAEFRSKEVQNQIDLRAIQSVDAKTTVAAAGLYG
jgi:hypothetical protein